MKQEIPVSDMNYISTSWSEFTAITPKEVEILKRIAGRPVRKVKMFSDSTKAIYSHLNKRRYESIKEAEIDLGISSSTICVCLKKNKKTKEGHYFSYI